MLCGTLRRTMDDYKLLIARLTPNVIATPTAVLIRRVLYVGAWSARFLAWAHWHFFPIDGRIGDGVGLRAAHGPQYSAACG